MASRRINYFYRRNVPTETARWIFNDYENTQITNLHPKLPFKIRNEKYKIKYKPANHLGGQLYGLSLSMTKLFRDERIECGINRGTELRGYAERLIVEAMRNGDLHAPTMELADFWLQEKDLIHKLFKELVPRYLDYTTSFTKIHKLGPNHEKADAPVGENVGFWWRGGDCILELKGNKLPPIKYPAIKKSGLITNILLKNAFQDSKHETSAEKSC